MNAMKNVLIVEDHTLISMSLKLMLRQVDEDMTINEAESFEEALHQISLHHFDLILLDIDIPGGKGTQMPGLIREKLPEVTILVCTSMDEEQNAERYLAEGASGFLSKSASKEEIVNAISTVLTGNKYVSATLQRKLLNDAFGVKTPSRRLSAREREVMHLLIEGKWTKEIAHILNISASTVSTFKARIFEKMQVDSVMELFRKVNAGEID